MTKLNKTILEEIDAKIYLEEIYINDKHEYDYSTHRDGDNHMIHTLSFSDSDDWSDDIKRKVAMQLCDDGNSVKIRGLCSKKNLTYLEAEQLHILLRLSSGNTVYKIAPPPVKREF